MVSAHFFTQFRFQYNFIELSCKLSYLAYRTTNKLFTQSPFPTHLQTLFEVTEIIVHFHCSNLYIETTMSGDDRVTQKYLTCSCCSVKLCKCQIFKSTLKKDTNYKCLPPNIFLSTPNAVYHVNCLLYRFVKLPNLCFPLLLPRGFAISTSS